MDSRAARMALTLVICTRNRADSLERCLEALKRAAVPGGCEVVVVNNGSTDRTAEVVAAFRGAAGFPVVAVREMRPGLSRARNRGLAAAAGGIVAFTDDDCAVAADYFAAMLAAFGDPGIGYVTGRVELASPGLGHTAVNERTAPYDLPAHGYVRTGRVLGANMAFRREVLAAIGGFDERLGSGTPFPVEDCDAAARASAAGWRGRYDPAVVVHHDHGRTPAQVGETRRDYDIGRGAYHMKLLAHGGARLAGVRGWLELPYRVLRGRASLLGELRGAWRWMRRARLPDATTDG